MGDRFRNLEVDDTPPPAKLFDRGRAQAEAALQVARGFDPRAELCLDGEEWVVESDCITGFYGGVRVVLR